jgi:hypothetical protein
LGLVAGVRADLGEGLVDGGYAGAPCDEEDARDFCGGVGLAEEGL